MQVTPAFQDPPLGAVPAATTTVSTGQFGGPLTAARFPAGGQPLYIAVNLNPGTLTGYTSLVITVPLPAPLTYDSQIGARLIEGYYDVTDQLGQVSASAGAVTYTFFTGQNLQNRNFSFSVPVLSGGAIPPTGIVSTPQVQYTVGGVTTTLTLNAVTLLPASPAPTYLSGVKLTPEGPLQRVLILTGFPATFYQEIQSAFPTNAQPGLTPSAIFYALGGEGVTFDPAAPLAVFLDGQDVTSQGVINLSPDGTEVSFTFATPQNLAGRTLVLRAKINVPSAEAMGGNVIYASNNYSVDGVYIDAGFFDIYGPQGIAERPFLTKILRLTPDAPGQSVLVLPSEEVAVWVDLAVRLFLDTGRQYFIADEIPFPYDVYSPNGEPMVQLLLDGVTPLPPTGLTADYNAASGNFFVEYSPDPALIGRLVVLRFLMVRNSALPLPRTGVVNSANVQVGYDISSPPLAGINLTQLLLVASAPLTPQSANALRDIIVQGGLPYASSAALILPPGAPGLPENCQCPPCPPPQPCVPPPQYCCPTTCHPPRPCFPTTCCPPRPRRGYC